MLTIFWLQIWKITRFRRGDGCTRLGYCWSLAEYDLRCSCSFAWHCWYQYCIIDPTIFYIKSNSDLKVLQSPLGKQIWSQMCKVRRKMATGLRERRLAEICKQHIPYWTGYNSKGSSHIISKDCSERKTEWAVTGQEGPLDQRGGQTTLVCPYSSHSRPEVLCIGGHFTEKDSVSYLASSSMLVSLVTWIV